MGQKLTDGKAGAVAFPSSEVINDYDLYRVNGITGLAIGALDATQTARTLGFEFDMNAEYSVLIPSALTPAVGDLLSWSSGTGFKRGDTHLVAQGTVGAVGPVFKVTGVKNAAGYVRGQLVRVSNKVGGGGGGMTEVGLISALTDNSGGVAVDGTIAAVNSSATAADGIKELATKVNEIIAALKTAGVVSST